MVFFTLFTSHLYTFLVQRLRCVFVLPHCILKILKKWGYLSHNLVIVKPPLPYCLEGKLIVIGFVLIPNIKNILTDGVSTFKICCIKRSRVLICFVLIALIILFWLLQRVRTFSTHSRFILDRFSILQSWPSLRERLQKNQSQARKEKKKDSSIKSF